jgi:hypothetical protein
MNDLENLGLFIGSMEIAFILIVIFAIINQRKD